jgi:DNA-binding NtrC family response regulator
VGSILIVESDPETRDRLGHALRDARQEVLHAFTPGEAIGMIRDGGIDLVVLDSLDPRVGVVDLVKSIDELPDGPPIVLVSASPFAPEISARIGAAAFVPKPLDPDEIVRLVGRLVGGLRQVRSFDDEPTGPARQLG